MFRLHITEHLITFRIWKVAFFYYVPCVKGCEADVLLIGIHWYDVDRGFKQYKNRVKIWK